MSQGSLGPGKPERHLHCTIQLGSRGEGSPGLRSAAQPTRDGTETEVTVGLERTHAEFLGQGEGLAVVDLSRRKLRGITMRSDVAQEPQGIGLIASLLMDSGVFEGTTGRRG